MLTKGKGEAGGMDLGTMASMMSSLGAGIQVVQMPQLLPETGSQQTPIVKSD